MNINQDRISNAIPCNQSDINNSLYCVISFYYTGCYNASFYGNNCDIPCPTNCKDNTCHIQSGACSTCKIGWSGIYCKTSEMAYSSPEQFKLFVIFFNLSYFNEI